MTKRLKNFRTEDVFVRNNDRRPTRIKIIGKDEIRNPKLRLNVTRSIESRIIVEKESNDYGRDVFLSSLVGGSNLRNLFRNWE